MGERIRESGVDVGTGVGVGTKKGKTTCGVSRLNTPPCASNASCVVTVSSFLFLAIVFVFLAIVARGVYLF